MRTGMIFIFSLFSFCFVTNGYAEPKNDTGIHTKLGQPCDPKTFDSYCDGDLLVKCSRNTITATNCAMKKDGDFICADYSDDVLKCKKGDRDCNRAKNAHRASCVSTSELCDIEGTSFATCKPNATGKTYTEIYTCDRTTNGQLVTHLTEKTPCYDGYGVCSDDGKCTPPVTCTSNYESNCNNNIAYNCKNNKVLTTDCSKSVSVKMCVMQDGEAKCMSPNKTCTNEGEISNTRCVEKMQHETYNICSKMEDGSLFEVMQTRPCLDGCSADKKSCKPVLCDKIGATKNVCQARGKGFSAKAEIQTYACTLVNGQKQWVAQGSTTCKGTCSADGKCVPAERCDRSNFEAHCDGSVGVSCIKDSVMERDCGVKGEACYIMNNHRHVGCVKTEASCTSDGQVLKRECKERDNGQATEATYICEAMDGGNFRLVRSNTRCPNGCSADGTTCAE